MVCNIRRNHKAPAGYKNKDYKIYIETKNGLVDISDNPVFVSAAERSGDGKSFKHLIYHPGNATTYGELETKGISVIKDENDPEVRMIFEDPEIRGNVQLTKRIEKQDDEGNDIPLANVKFKIESLSSDGSTLETHFIFTDEKGHVSTRQDLILEAEEYMKYVNHYDLVDDDDGTPSVIWFDGTKSADSNPPSAEKSGRGALPFGKYRITEMRCKANKGRQLEEPVTFEISEENQLVNVFDKNAEASDEKITNVPQPELSTTAVVKDTDLKCIYSEDYKKRSQFIDTADLPRTLWPEETITLLTELMIVDEEGNISPYMEGDKEYKRIENFSTELSYSRSRFESKVL